MSAEQKGSRSLSESRRLRMVRLGAACLIGGTLDIGAGEALKYRAASNYGANNQVEEQLDSKAKFNFEYGFGTFTTTLGAIGVGLGGAALGRGLALRRREGEENDKEADKLSVS